MGKSQGGGSVTEMLQGAKTQLRDGAGGAGFTEAHTEMLGIALCLPGHGGGGQQSGSQAGACCSYLELSASPQHAILISSCIGGTGAVLIRFSFLSLKIYIGFFLVSHYCLFF